MRISDWSSDVCSSDLHIMQIVPLDEDLVVIAKVNPRDIDSLNNGVTRVQVRMTSFSQRFTHPVEGHLESISADVVDDGRGVPPYYRAIIRLDETSREHLLHGVELTFGMRSEEHTSELQSLMRISYAVFCLQK